MNQDITADFSRAWRHRCRNYSARVRRRDLKREARRRRRSATRMFFARGDWYGGVISVRPVSAYDVI